MNILEIFTLNKHGDFEEVLFSSVLSYLLDPRRDHGLGDALLRKVLGKVFSNDAIDISRTELTPEKSFKDKGNIIMFT